MSGEGSCRRRPVRGLELEGSLRRSSRREGDALQFEHAPFGGYAARCGKAAELTARGQHPVAGDDEGYRVMGHGLADIAGGLRPSAQLLCQRAVGGCVAPLNPSRRGIDPAEKIRLGAKVELEVGKIRLFTGKVAVAALTARATSAGGVPGWACGRRRRSWRLAAAALLAGS